MRGKMMWTLGVVLVQLGIAGIARGAAPLPADDFNDNRRADIWYLLETDPATASLAEQNARLEFGTAAGGSAGDAYYLLRGSRLSTEHDFEFKVQWHLVNATPSGETHVRLGLRVPSVDGEVHLNVASGAGKTWFYANVEAAGRADRQILTNPRTTTEGWSYFSYDAATDTLFVSVNGYRLAPGSDAGNAAISGVLRGEWGAGDVLLFLGGDTDSGAVVGPGEAWVDNFEITQGVLVTPSPRTVTVTSTPNSGIQVDVRPDPTGAPTGSANTPSTRTYDEGMPVFLTAPATDAQPNSFAEWRRDGNTFSTNRTLVAATDANRTWTAVYGDAGTHYTISGYIKQSGTGVAGVEMIGLPDTPQTDANGFYTASVNAGWSGTVAPRKVGQVFSPAARACTNVTANQANRDYAGFADTDSDADGLPDGWELIWFDDLNQTAWTDPDADGLVNGQEFRTSADPSNLDTDADGYRDLGEVTIGSDPTDPVRPDHGVTIQGIVSSSSPAELLAGCLVFAVAKAAVGEQWPVLCASGATGATGAYSVSVPTGVEVVVFAMQADDYAATPVAPYYWGQFYPGVTTQSAATVLVRADAGTIPGIDFTLAPGALLSGAVTDAASGQPVAYAAVEALAAADRHLLTRSYTQADGSYRLVTPANTEMILQAGSDGYRAKYYDNTAQLAAATRFTPTADQALTGRNFTLDSTAASPHPRRVTTHGASDWDADWSPDGATLIFGSDRAGAWQAGVDWAGFGIYTVSAATGETPAVPAHVLVNPAGWDGYPRYSPDGTKIALERGIAGNPQGIWTAAADGTGQVRVTTTGNQPNWSPDGTQLVFSDFNDLWIANADGSGTPALLLQRPGTDWHPAWSPDGQRIVTVSDTDGEWALWLVNRDGTGARKLTRCDPYAEPDWRPNGSEIAFGGTDDKIWAISPQDSGNGATLRRITIGGSRDTDPNWSPDGQRLAFTSNRAGSDDIWIVSAAGESPILHDDFNDNVRGSMWYAVTLPPANPDQVQMSESGKRLHFLCPTAAAQESVAMYALRHAALDASRDFAAKVDWHFTKTNGQNVRLNFSVFSPGGWADITVEYDSDPISGGARFAFMNSTPATFPEQTVARAPGMTSGTFYIAYDNVADRLYLSVHGFRQPASNAGDWVIDGLVRGAWGAPRVGFSLEGNATQATVAAGEAGFDNFEVIDGARVSPPARTFTVTSTPLAGVPIAVRPDQTGRPAVTAYAPFTQSFDDGASAVLTAPETDSAGNPFLYWEVGVPASRVTARELVLAMNADKPLRVVYSADNVAIAGTVMQAATPLAGVEMSGLPGNPLTDGNGLYTAKVPVGWTGTVTPRQAGLVFSPGTRRYSNVAVAHTAQDYAAFAATDTDGDQLPDAWETARFGALNQSGWMDPDADGLINYQEFLAGTNPNDVDTDKDGYRDLGEVVIGSDPADAAAPDHGVTLQGTINSGTPAAPLAGCTVFAVVKQTLGADWPMLCASGLTNAAGAYSLTVPTGVAVVLVAMQADDYLAVPVAPYYEWQFYPGTTPPEATVFSRPASATITGIDFTLTPGALVSGTVTDAVTGQPVPFAGVDALAAGDRRLLMRDHTRADGTYRLVLSAGTEFILQAGSDWYRAKYADNVAQPADAARFTLAAGQALTGKNFALEFKSLLADHVLKVGMFQGYNYNTPGSPLTYEFSQSVETDAAVTAVAFQTPAGKTFTFPQTAYQQDGYAESEYSYDFDGRRFVWDRGLNDLPTLDLLKDYGDGDYLFTFRLADGSQAQTTVHFVNPGTGQAIVQPTTKPVFTAPLHNSLLPTPVVTFAWEAAADTVNACLLSSAERKTNTDVADATLPATTTSYGPVSLKPGSTYEADVSYANRYTGATANGVIFEVAKYSAAYAEFAVASPYVRRVTTSAATEWDPDWSPDGQKILFGSDRSGAGTGTEKFDLFTVNAATGETAEDPAVPLVGGAGWQGCGSYSPNGTRVVFEHGGGADSVGIWIANADGTNPVRLMTSGAQPSWSPDGSMIVFLDNDDLWLVPVAGGAATPLRQRPATDWHPAWAPSGDRIAFTTNASGAWRLCLINRDGTGLQELSASRPTFCGEPNWRPDGAEIAFEAEDGDIWAISPTDSGDGRTLRRITTRRAGDHDPVWSPDGQWLAFTSDRAGSDDVWIVRAAGEPILFDDFNDNVRGSMWSALTLPPANPDQVRMSETGGELHFLCPTAAPQESVALYALRQAALDAAQDFAAKVDWHFTKADGQNARLNFSVFSPGGWADITVEYDSANGGAKLAFLNSKPETFPEQTVARAPGMIAGTFYIAYDTAADRLYLSVHGFRQPASAAGDWVIDGLVRGAWSATHVGFSLEGNATQTTVAAGEAGFDTFEVTQGALVTPPTRMLTVTSTPNPSVPIVVRPDQDGAPTATASSPITRTYDEGGLVFLTAPADDGQGRAFRQWLVDGSPLSTQATIQLPMTREHTATAVYALPDATVAGTQAAAPYTPGSTCTVSCTLTFTGTLTEAGWSATLPTGWTYATGTNEPGSKPAAGDSGTLNWSWNTVPASPINFTYTLTVPAGQSGDKQIAAVAKARGANGLITSPATPNPLVVAGPDVTPPTLTVVHIQSTNANSARARIGDSVTLSFTASEAIKSPTVTIAGHAATASQGRATHDWSATYTMVAADVDGVVPFRVEFADLANNPGAPVTQSTDASAVTFAKDWVLTLNVTNADKASVQFGMHPDAGDKGLEDLMDKDCPPAPNPPNAKGGLFFLGFIGDIPVSLSTDMRRTKTTDVWNLEAVANSNPMVISWDTATVPPGRSLYLWEVNTQGQLVTGARHDMQVTGSLEIPASTVRHLVLYCGPVGFPLVLETGWNMISLPLEPLNPAVSVIFAATRGDTTGAEQTLADSTRGGTLHSGEVWSWIASGGGHYQTVTELHPLKAYWIYVQTPVTVVVPGTPPATGIANLPKGWNLVGPTKAKAAPYGNPDIWGRIWRWNTAGSQYEAVEDPGLIQPGCGYWVMPRKALTLNLGE